jgi:hypothetical protein
MAMRLSHPGANFLGDPVRCKLAITIEDHIDDLPRSVESQSRGRFWCRREDSPFFRSLHGVVYDGGNCPRLILPATANVRPSGANMFVLLIVVYFVVTS